MTLGSEVPDGIGGSWQPPPHSRSSSKKGAAPRSAVGCKQQQGVCVWAQIPFDPTEASQPFLGRMVYA